MNSPVCSRRAFTLIELLISFAVLAMISLVIFGIVNSTSSLWRQTKGKVETFRESRAAFETIVQRLSQATLNTYWGFEDPNDPGDYVRLSELHFIAGPAGDLLGTPASDTPTSAVFFQAPLGYAKAPSRLNNLLNEAGYFIQFGDDTDTVPLFLQSTHEPRFRYRLMEFLPATEDLQIYNPALAGKNDWFQQSAAANPPVATRPIAENIIAFVVRPRLSTADAAVGQALSTNYTYDSRDENQPTWINQLPPVLDILMVAIDETSAMRLADGSQPTLDSIVDSEMFTTDGDFDADIERLRLALVEENINFRIFQTTIAPREAKWAP